MDEHIGDILGRVGISKGFGSGSGPKTTGTLCTCPLISMSLYMVHYQIQDISITKPGGSTNPKTSLPGYCINH